MCQACFTGIESTKKITLSKEEKRLIELTPEEKFLNDINGEEINCWKTGKPFLIADRKASIVLTPMDGALSVDRIIGDTVYYTDFIITKGIDGSEEFIAIFSHPTGKYKYSTRKSGIASRADIYSDRLPMMIDIDMVRKIADKLIGQTVYPLSPNWLDSAGNRIQGSKYIKAVITDVTHGDQINPIRISFEVPEQMKKGIYMMSYPNDRKSARDFAILFSLSDPYKSHQEISKEVWDNICHSTVTPGMNKNECRLALGNPEDVTATRDYSQTIDIWKYTDGTVLFFQDGVLTKRN